MDRILRPERLETDPNSGTAAKEWLHWKRTFDNFLAVLPQEDLDKLAVLSNFVSPSIFQHIEDCEDYETSIEALQTLFIKPRNEVFARHLLATRKQAPTETLDEYLKAPKALSKDCNFKNVTAVQYCEESIRDAFIAGLQSNMIRQRLLENKTLDLKTMFDQARSLESAMKSSESYSTPNTLINAAIPAESSSPLDTQENTLAAAVVTTSSSCYFCGNNRHPRSKCPAKDATCAKCQKKGHYAKVCQSKATSRVSASLHSPVIAATQSPGSLSKSTATISLENLNVKALFDSGSTESFIHPNLVKRAGLTVKPSSSAVSMASTALSANVTGTCRANLEYQNQKYSNLCLSVLPGLCADLILGLDFQSQHESITFQYGGSQPPLSVCGFSTLNMDPAEPFSNLTQNCHPIASKSRRYSRDDLKFIDGEVERLLKEGIIEPSNSPWRAQVVVTKDDNHKKRLAIDYSQTINRFTQLDAFPLPRINDLVNDIAQYRVFSTIDLRSAYHQVPLKKEDQQYTAFEACNKLYQFTRLPFGVTNGVACFQREMMKFIEQNNLSAVFPYLDNITICGKNQQEHDANLEKFLAAAKEKNICYNNSKSVFSTRKLAILGYEIEEGIIRPDPERLRPLRNLPVPHDSKSLNRCLGLFSYYSQWIPEFSNRIKPLTSSKSFPLPPIAVTAFDNLKKTVEEAFVTAIDETVPFEVETDASDVALAATLSQVGRPVAFFSRSLQGSELKHASIEKEAQAIIEAIRHWRHFLTGRHFTLRTDQKSVSYMFDQRNRGKIKNDKIMRWRLELACYSFDIVYRPGKENVLPDALSRAICATALQDSLYTLHEALCHPGVTRLNHFVRSKNLPYSMEEVKRVTNQCQICAESKPQYHKPEEVPLIKATQPFERINIDFKGPLPSNNENRYFLNIVDEYSRFPFVFPCSDISTSTVIKCFTTLFSLFGMPAYVHSDRGTSFMSHELKAFLRGKGIATSRTTSYNPAGNGQVERYNGVVRKAIETSLKSKNLHPKYWQVVLPDALHSIRSLLCTATNETPHERMFRFPRRSSSGASVPTWMAEPGPVLLKRHVRTNKTEPLVDEVELLQANPHYAFVRYPDGRETTVSTKHLAPKPPSTSPVQIQPLEPCTSPVQIQPQDCVPETTTVDSSVQQDIPTATNQAS
ncbi:MAG: DDE-type integrase/transposase/recombinase, partial [bacterium]|nr:DDE-type integrase/transposase/recombinase [bacterium]